ncbi:hypothetical protein I4U23_019868 [Adineta vaga]|nr:hypothetical protein I4U23_019868 [Adineta vaga]
MNISSISQLDRIQQYLTRYGMTSYMTLGNLGLIFNFILFSQRTHRRNPCSLYILAMSFCGIIGLNISLIPIILKLDHQNPFDQSIFLCRFHNYLIQIFNQSMRTFIVIACADRYAICSRQATIRSFSQYKVAIRVIVFVFIFWLFLALLPTMQYSNENNICEVMRGVPNLIDSIYTLVCFGVVPLFSMMIFGMLMMINLAQMRSHIQPVIDGTVLINHRIFRRRDRDMIRMLSIELLLYIFTTVPVTVILIYKTVAENKVKNELRIQIESFLFYIMGYFILYLNNCLSFWIYIFTSRTFRLEFQQLFRKIMGFMVFKPRRLTETG